MLHDHDSAAAPGTDVKRVIDVALAIPVLVISSPVMLLIAAGVKLTSRGPVFYSAPRAGRDGRTFQMVKFRTMHVGAPDVRNADGSTFAGSGDARVTALGWWLRRTSLDELPQFWNVLRGDMSIVGPRPDLPDQLAMYQEGDRRRLDMRPGITGLAQVSGRNDLDWAARRKLDVEYVNSWSVWLDLRILMRTIPRILGARGVFTREGPPAR